MATLEQIANKKGACDSPYYANTGTKGDQIQFGTPTSLIGLKRGFVIPKTQELTVQYINSLIASRTAVPLIGAVNFEDLSAEDGLNTKSNGVERLNLKGLSKGGWTFEEGHEFYRESSKLTSYKAYDWLIFDEVSRCKIAVTSTGDFKGFTAGQVVASATKFKVQGGEDEGKMLSIQFTNRKQTDINYAILDNCELGFDINEDIMGVNSATPVFVSTPAAGTDIVVDVLLDADMTTAVAGITDGSSFKYFVNGVAKEVTAVVEDLVVSGRYTLTVPTLVVTEEIKLSLSDTPTEIEGFTYAGGEIARATIVA